MRDGRDTIGLAIDQSLWHSTGAVMVPHLFCEASVLFDVSVCSTKESKEWIYVTFFWLTYVDAETPEDALMLANRIYPHLRGRLAVQEPQ